MIQTCLYPLTSLSNLLNFFSNAINAKLNGDKFTLVSDYGHYVYRRVFSVDQNGNPDRSEVVRRSVATKQGLELLTIYSWKYLYAS